MTSFGLKYDDRDAEIPKYRVPYWTLLFLHITPISGSYSSDFVYRLYPSLIMKKLKIEFSPKALHSTAVEEVLIIRKKFARFFGPRMFIRS